MSHQLQRHILVIDDDPMDRMLIFRSLRELDLDCKLSHLEDGQEVLDFIRDHEGEALQYTLIMLDLKMPRIDGLEVLRRLRGSPVLERVPIVVMSSSAINADIEAAYALGARAYVTKPIRHDEFRSAVHTLGTFWVTQNRLPSSPQTEGVEPA